MARRPGRPRGTLGPIAQAMLQAASDPGTVDELARRALVGRASANYTATRLVQAGMLEVVEPRSRPAVLQRPQRSAIAGAASLEAALALWRMP